MMLETRCNKCGTSFQVDLGTMSKEAAEIAFRNLDRNGGHCPGRHVELGGLWKMWNLEDLLHRAFDIREATASATVPTDEDYVKNLQVDGKEVWDGGTNRLPHLNLPSIHSAAHLRHIGCGNFENSTHSFLRADSPLGTRFYIREPR